MWRFGHRVRDNDADWRRESGWRPENLRKRGLAPATLVDVGVGRGTAGLYEAFPDAFLVLVEPLAEFEGEAAGILACRAGEHIAAAVGAARGTATIRVDLERPAASSTMRLRHPPARHGEPGGIEEREVPLTTLDALLAERAWDPPFGLKVDVEGLEHQVIEGAPEMLRRTEFVIAEVNVMPRFEDSYTFAEFVALMDSRGFRLTDVVDGVKWPTGEVAWLDLLFRRSARRA
jgi:FkbM family methyltransferase